MIFQGLCISSAPKVVKKGNAYLPLAKSNVDEEENDSEEEADGSNHDIGDAQKVVFAAQQGGCRKDHTLISSKLVHSKV